MPCGGIYFRGLECTGLTGFRARASHGLGLHGVGAESFVLETGLTVGFWAQGVCGPGWCSSFACIGGYAMRIFNCEGLGFRV